MNHDTSPSSSIRPTRIFRSAPKENYTVLPNAMLNDAALTFDARGMLAMLLSKPPHWETNVKHLINASPNGKEKVRRILDELIEATYIRREHGRGPDGRLGHVEYFVYDRRQVEDLMDTASRFATSGSASSGKPGHVVSTERQQGLTEASTDVRPSSDDETTDTDETVDRRSEDATETVGGKGSIDDEVGEPDDGRSSVVAEIIAALTASFGQPTRPDWANDYDSIAHRRSEQGHDASEVALRIERYRARVAIDKMRSPKYRPTAKDFDKRWDEVAPEPADQVPDWLIINNLPYEHSYYGCYRPDCAECEAMEAWGDEQCDGCHARNSVCTCAEPRMYTKAA